MENLSEIIDDYTEKKLCNKRAREVFSDTESATALLYGEN